ncbi:RIIa domain-containing protein 1 [Schistosoma haematobium]|uniref:RIIa domain-containing protein 1 n=1 Tax=Schistosoma haematobium TaxID=6185 RepID=A0A095AMT1_SCHHA|nr:RIIa domain-containing protein 1 [Schistosoma haematobium]KAH9588549.1 RIIa domain-containing protein 1 [Schistosoma haematobium]
MFDPGSYRPNHDPPAGMEPYDLPTEGDLGALSNAQQGATNKLKAQTRLNNEHYLRKHPEIKYMITAFLRDILTKQPEDAREHFVDFFTSPNLESNIENIKKEFTDQYHDDQVIRSMAQEKQQPEI